MELEYDILSYFPTEIGEPRDRQIDILNSIEKAIEADYKYIVLKAGTGIGKSAIAATLANAIGSAFIVTGTKDLQRQYNDELPYPLLFGRRNFTCITNGFECDIGECKTGLSDFKCEWNVTPVNNDVASFAFKGRDSFWYWKDAHHCNYWEQKANVINSEISILNYPSYYLEMNYVPIVPKRDLVVFDEAQNIENEIMSQLGHVISNKHLKKVFKKFEDYHNMKAPQLTESELLDDSPSPITIDNWIIRINTLLSIYKEARDLNSIEEDPNHKLDLRELEGLERDILKLETIQQELVENPRNWVFTGNIKLGVKNGSFEMKPVWIDEYTEKYMFRHAKNHVLIMSATLPPKKEFCKWHGLNEDDVYYIDVESNFKLENRQIQIITRGKMTKNDYHRTFPLIAPIINTILSRHKNEKGIIHTQSDKYTKMVYDAIYDKNRVFWYSKDDETKKKREEIIKKFKKTSMDGAVLVSPGIKEGIDLPGDMCEYQIILKIPFPYLGDKQIKRRLHDEPSWYAYKTANDLEQAYGRGVRTYNDKCTTYIVDGSILRIKNSREHRRFMSKYFKKALDTAIIN